MDTTPSRDPNDRYVPPDPGGRSRYLIRGIAIACIVCAIIAVILMLVLRSATPPPTQHQQQSSGGQALAVPVVNTFLRAGGRAASVLPA